MISRVQLILLLLLTILSAPAGASEEVVVLFPPDLTLATDPVIKVYAFRAGKAGDPVPVRVNGQDAEPLRGEVFLSGEIALTPGRNELDVGGRTVRVYDLPGSRMDRYRLPEVDGKEPVVFRAYRIHPALEDGCEGCHSVAGGGKLTVAMDQKRSCYECHDDFEKGEGEEKRHVHGPVQAGECTSCHDPHYASRPKLSKLEKGCYECHDPFPEDGTVHRPVKTGECTACHGPHTGAAPKMLLRAGNALCLGCHETPHATHRSAEVKGRSTQVPPDFPREKDELVCTGCHFPHRSPERRLFRMPQGKLCQMCHPL